MERKRKIKVDVVLNAALIVTITVVSLAGFRLVLGWKGSGITDFCDYTSLDSVEKQSFRAYNKYQRPVIDIKNKLYICVTPKAGITKIQAEFKSYLSRERGYKVPANAQNEEQDKFIDLYGPIEHSFPQSNFTKIFIYRNPVDRFISLWQDKFTRERYNNAWVSMVFVNDYRIPSVDLLLKNLYYYIVHGLEDPHIWPQIDYCRVDRFHYDKEVDIDDHRGLTELFAPYWGEKEVDFEAGTAHATKDQAGHAEAHLRLREKVELWRNSFAGSYWRDIDYYCKDRGNKGNKGRAR
uniref:Sulfotransferase domain-containing protein n=1 Tax=Rhodosorus marinus TaxID=101924 RepID=A0A7S2ZM10_9RHOD